MQTDVAVIQELEWDSTALDLKRELSAWRFIAKLLCWVFFLINILLLNYRHDGVCMTFLVGRLDKDRKEVPGNSPTLCTSSQGFPVKWSTCSNYDHGWNTGRTITRTFNFYYVIASIFVSLTLPLFILEWWLRPAFDAFAADRRCRILPRGLSYFIPPVLFVSLFVAVLSTFLPMWTVTTTLP